ncbi:hypothetical protein OG568_59810 (plasmid) [Streptomyces sp. NBC_01450]|uniref:trypsin-like serine peptidase n=1 Tax=Streptomyces sp. NBC_01450 TaxID=2903871 RepID=UPI002E332727|nr:hypothetical protein [Streptomyces sp. NBC_01450]
MSPNSATRRRSRSLLGMLAAAVLLTVSGCRITPPATTPEPVGSFREPGTWTSSQMSEAAPYDIAMPNDAEIDPRVSDPEPTAVTARPEEPPYVDHAAVLGKVFFETPDGPRVCSGTAVTDPNAHGASSLVWTAAHCVHTGKPGTWYRNIVFVPSYNNEALPGASSADRNTQKISPLGVWWADRASISPGWAQKGEASGGAGASFDYAVLHVRLSDNPDASLERTIGYAIPVAFNAPPVTSIPTLKIWGYPAETPFDGNLLFSCQDRPTRFSPAADDPTLYRIGCTMNGGASGGGWFMATADGSLELVSNTSVGPSEARWLAGPRLGAEARAMLNGIGDTA